MQSKAPTAGWPISETHTKIDLPTNQKGCDNSETTDEKLSARRIQIFRVSFSVIIFDLLFFKTSKHMVPTKIYHADLDSRRRIL